MVVTTLWARAVDRVAVVDVAWGLGFVLVALVAALLGGTTDADERRWLVLALVGGLGRPARRGTSGRQAVGHGEDPRYEELLGGTLDRGRHAAGRSARSSSSRALAMWFVVAAGGHGRRRSRPGGGRSWSRGAALWLVGLVFEAVGDAQLAAYKALPKDQRPPVMQTGLWRYTRHPNYFGDACVCVGTLARRRPRVRAGCRRW